MKAILIILLASCAIASAQINLETTPQRSGWVFSCANGSEDTIPPIVVPPWYGEEPIVYRNLRLREILAEAIESLKWFVAEARPSGKVQVQKAREVIQKAETYLGGRL